MFLLGECVTDRNVMYSLSLAYPQDCALAVGAVLTMLPALLVLY